MVKADPTVVFIGMVALAVASGIGEYIGKLPAGTFSTLVGILVGTGVYHTAINQNNSTSTDSSNSNNVTTTTTTSSNGKSSNGANSPTTTTTTSPPTQPVSQTAQTTEGVNG